MKNPRVKKIVLTGGPGVGKTSLIRCLQQQGYATRPEVFTHFFEKAQRAGNFNETFLRSAHLIHDLISQQVLHERDTDQQQSPWIFLDRCLIDIWGYTQNLQLTLPPTDQQLIEAGKYDLIFLIEPLPANKYEQNALRRQSYQEALEHHQRHRDFYERYFLMQQRPGPPFINVPYTPNSSTPENRAQFLLKEAQKKFS